MSTRRKFLLQCSAAATSAALVPATAWAVHPRFHDVSLDSISVAAWAGQLNSYFIVRDKSNRIAALRLAGAEALDDDLPAGSLSGDVQRERFSLFFVGSTSTPLGQDTYWFEHANMGRFQMFIVPIGLPAATQCLYEAVFDRLTTVAPQRRNPGSYRAHQEK